MAPELFTVDQLARTLHIGKNYAYTLIQTGQIPAKKLGRKYYIRLEDIEKFLEKYFATP